MIAILRPGFLTTVQDLGRPGQRRYGVSLGGALDAPALTVGNRLVGNAADAAGLEFTLGGAQLQFHSATHIALTGADCAAQLDGTPVPCGWRWRVAAGQTLSLQAPNSGVRTYLTVAGGIDVPSVLGSRSTDLNAGFGGLAGRALRRGDCLPLGAAARLPQVQGVRLPQADAFIRALPGPEYEQFGAAAQSLFWQTQWRIGAQSNRMGYRLESSQPLTARLPEQNSHAVLPGTVQVPPNGQPIVLLADAQTTGGYPKIAVVITADLWKLAQLPPGAKLQFVPCTLEQAATARCKLNRYLASIEAGLYGH